MENKTGKLQEPMESHPQGQPIRVEKAPETPQQRENAAVEIARLRAELSSHPTPDEGTQELEAELVRLETAVEQLREEISAKRMDISQKRVQIESRIKALESRLWEGSDTRIDEGIAFFQAEHEKLLRTTVNAAKGTNYPAIVASMSYCRQCIAELMAMKFEAEPDFIKIENLKRCLPTVDEFGEFEGTSFIPKTQDAPSEQRSRSTADYPSYQFRKDGDSNYLHRENDYFTDSLKKVGEIFKKWKSNKK